MATDHAATGNETSQEGLLWATCSMCWGQRQIWTRPQAANGEGAILVAAVCAYCLGIGEVAAA